MKPSFPGDASWYWFDIGSRGIIRWAPPHGGASGRLNGDLDEGSDLAPSRRNWADQGAKQFCVRVGRPNPVFLQPRRDLARGSGVPMSEEREGQRWMKLDSASLFLMKYRPLQ
jgi:hypothetical protein